jgi:hypothetical protein
MIINKAWAMPNKNTFSIKPIKALICSYFSEYGGNWIDPFSRNSPFNKYQNMITNDLDTSFQADSHKEALEFISGFGDRSLDGCLFDPPYSPRQIQECYNSIGRTVHQQDTQSSFYGDRKKALASKIKSRGIVMSFGWNSGGICKTLGFEQIEILIVAHGGAHNDTICVVERKH